MARYGSAYSIAIDRVREYASPESDDDYVTDEMGDMLDICQALFEACGTDFYENAFTFDHVSDRKVRFTFRVEKVFDDLT